MSLSDDDDDNSEFVEVLSERDAAVSDEKDNEKRLENEGDERSTKDTGMDETIEEESVNTITISSEEETAVESEASSTVRTRSTAFDMARKAGVAVSGAALTGIGLVMIPLPTPFGCVVAASGMAVLGSEFPAAQKVLDDTRDAVVRTLERNCNDDDDDNNCTMQQESENEDDFVVVEKPGTATTTATEQKENTDTDTKEWTLPARVKKAGKRLGQNAIPILKSLGSSTSTTTTTTKTEPDLTSGDDAAVS